MVRLLEWLIVSVMLIMLSGCGGGSVSSENPQEPTSKIKLLSPKGSVTYSYVTLEVKDNVTDVKADVNGTEYKGVKNGSSYLIYNVPLKKGTNEITLIANGGKDKSKIKVESEGKGFAPVGVNAERREGFGKLSTTLKVATSLSASEYMLDRDNDGVVDEKKSSSDFSVSYDEEGRYFPMATVRTSDGVLYSTKKNLSIDIMEEPKEVKTLDIEEQIYDIERFSGYVWALSSTKIYIIDENNDSLIKQLSIENVSNPKGFCYDNDENLYIVDSGNNRIIKLLAESNYQLDTFRLQNGSFGREGESDGEFEDPSDCMVDSTLDKVKIYVVDSGNNRVQVFNDTGGFLYKITKSDNLELSRPIGLLASSKDPVVSDSGNDLIRFFNQEGKEKGRSTGITLNNPHKMSLTTGAIIVSDTDNNRIVFLSLLGDFIKELKLSEPPLAAVQINSKNNNIYIAYKNKNGLLKLSSALDFKNEKPLDIVQNFVNALNNEDAKAMESLTTSRRMVDNILNSDKYKKLLPYVKKHIKSYKLDYQDKSFASVLILFDNTERTLKVGLLKNDNQWLIHKF